MPLILPGKKKASDFDPVNDIGWRSCYYAEGDEFVASGPPTTVSTWHDEVSTYDLVNYGALSAQYTSSESTMNNQPAVYTTPGQSEQVRNTSMSLTESVYSVVFVGNIPNTSDYAYDGTTSSNRIALYSSFTGRYWSGSGGNTTVVADTAVVCSVLDTGGDDEVFINETSQATASPGISTFSSGITFGNKYYAGADNAKAGATCAFFGIFVGDVTADSNWSAFNSWAYDKYNIT
jgi:hypothetical protein